MVTKGADGAPHCAPMGPMVDDELTSWLLRPFQTSTTFKNLQRDPHCVFHTTDNVLLLVQLVLGHEPDLSFDDLGQGWRLKSACDWFVLKVEDWDISQLRSEARARLLDRGHLRSFWGWNRAKHAVLEATILVTRLHLLEKSFVESEFRRFESAIQKTAGKTELQAWNLLQENLSNHSWDEPACD